MTNRKTKRLGVDVGGTYTDLVLLDEVAKEVLMAKVPSIPDNPAQGIIEGIKALDLDLSTVQFIVHGTTIGINTIIQKNGAKTGLLTTAGFEDILEIGTMSKAEMYNLFYRKPRPLVSRQNRLGISERMTFDGKVLKTVSRDNVLAQVHRLRDEQVTSIAIATLHSYANPENEISIAEIVQEEFPELDLSVSHKIINQRREFERTSTTVLNAYIAPAAKAYLKELQTKLAELGFEGVVFIMKSNGGVMGASAAASTPVPTLLSGPVAGSIAGKALGQALQKGDVITFDMGGTSCDISVILNGEPSVTFEAEVEGYPVMTPMVEIKYLGAGGGSIAKVIGENSLRVGPESAGAEPGPACYMQGGSQPTVTDANLILGRLDPSQSLAGGIPLNRDLASAAVKRQVADPLGLSVEEAALGIVEIACVKMAYAIREVTIEQGLDPRSFILLSFGGAGNMHTPFIAKMVGINQIVVPWSPGTLCAWGMLNTDLRHDLVRTIDYAGRQLDKSELVYAFSELEAEGFAELVNQGVDSKHIQINRAIDMRYVGQEHTITVPLSQGEINDQSLAMLRADYDQIHERKYAHSSPEEPVEFVNIRVEAVGILEKPGVFAPVAISANGNTTPIASYIRPVWFREGLLETPIYARAHLSIGSSLDGPAVIIEDGSTTLLPPEFKLKVDNYGNMIIDVPEA
jgi:N-methylhydantoinase A